MEHYAENIDEYLDWVKAEIEEAYNCPAYYLRTELVQETMDGETLWAGEVQVFGLIGHEKAKRCFAWGHDSHNSSQAGRLIMMLAIPPSLSAQAAVRLQLVKAVTSDFCLSSSLA
jgi:hypothetical protein